jgi:hypothetical protein
MLFAAPVRTAFATSIAIVMSFSSAPAARALPMLQLSQDWQFTAIDAPTAISAFV